MSAAESPWDRATPVNTGSCSTHGPHVGLICGRCAVARWDASPPRGPARRAYARVLGAEPAALDPGSTR